MTYPDVLAGGPVTQVVGVDRRAAAWAGSMIPATAITAIEMTVKRMGNSFVMVFVAKDRSNISRFGLWC